jgi:hypothetical protein
MRFVLAVLIGLVFCLASQTAQAQVLASRPTLYSEERLEELREWVRDTKDYLKWFARYRNRVVWATFYRSGDRKKQPPEPTWLEAECVSIPKDMRDGLFKEACGLLDTLNGVATRDSMYQQKVAKQLQVDEPKHTTFLERLHLDAGWTFLHSGNRAFGLVGMHVTLIDIGGKVHLYGPPGVILIAHPSGGGWKYKPGYTWGISIDLFTFDIPGTKQKALAHMNFAKVWMFGKADTNTIREQGMDFGGLSLTWKKNK